MAKSTLIGMLRLTIEVLGWNALALSHISNQTLGLNSRLNLILTHEGDHPPRPSPGDLVAIRTTTVPKKLWAIAEVVSANPDGDAGWGVG